MTKGNLADAPGGQSDGVFVKGADSRYIFGPTELRANVGAGFTVEVRKDEPLTKSWNVAAGLVMAVLVLAALTGPSVGHAQVQLKGPRRFPVPENPQAPADPPASTTKPAVGNLGLRQPDTPDWQNTRALHLLHRRVTSFSPIPPPINLTYTSDAGACVAHAAGGTAEGVVAGLVCKSLLPQGKLVLIWDYANSSELKGFRIYMSVAGGQERLLATQNPEVTLYLPDPPQPSGYASACFRVTAMVGDEESTPSAWFCGDRAKLIRTVTLKPVLLRSVYKGNDDFHPNQTQSIDADFDAGYFFDAWEEDGASHYSNDITRGAAMFDAVALAGRQIFSARLRLQVDSTCSGSDIGTKCVDHFTSCGALLFEGSPQYPWWKNQRWIEVGPPVASPGVKAGPGIVIDVTNTVQGWVSGRPNNGLVIAGDNENLVNAAVPGSPKCITGYVVEAMALEVSYFDPASASLRDSGSRIRPIPLH